jgi:hypothetical protein
MITYQDIESFSYDETPPTTPSAYKRYVSLWRHGSTAEHELGSDHATVLEFGFA